MQTDILLSIKPEFAEAILKGVKQFEYRRRFAVHGSATRVLVYASAPVSQVIGEFVVRSIRFRELDELWRETGHAGGIEFSEFENYFSGLDHGYAVEVENPIRYDVSIDLKEGFDIDHPPQSFRYLRSVPVA